MISTNDRRITTVKGLAKLKQLRWLQFYKTLLSILREGTIFMNLSHCSNYLKDEIIKNLEERRFTLVF